nr:DUF4199 domain-containing protein [uncultured Flavobacterium sp.]
MSSISTQKPKVGKIALNYGLIFGAILIVEFVIGYVLGAQMQKEKSYAIVISLINYIALPFTFAFLAGKKFKELNGGYITFGEAIKLGVAVAVIAALVSGIFSAIFNIIIPEYMEDTLKRAEEEMAKNPQMKAADIKMAMKFTRMFMEPYIVIPIAIVMNAFVGLINSLVVGAIIKKENPFGDMPQENINNIGDE